MSDTTPSVAWTKAAEANLAMLRIPAAQFEDVLDRTRIPEGFPDEQRITVRVGKAGANTVWKSAQNTWVVLGVFKRRRPGK